MKAWAEHELASSTRLLDRFYRIFLGVCLVFLTVGVPFVFVRKTASLAIILLMTVAVLLAWRMSRRGQPKKSLTLFAIGLWLVLVGLLYGGLPPVSAAAVLAMSVLLAVVVHLRAGVAYGVSYLLAWLLYIGLQAAHLAPAPYFTGATLTGWFMGVVAIWLVLLPIPDLVLRLRKAASLQRAVIEAASDGILVVNTQGKVETFNQHFADLWHIPLAVVQAGDDAAMLDYVVQQLAEPGQFLQKVQELYAHPDQTSVDTLHFKDGRVVERQSHPQRLDEAIVGRVWSFRDVTEKEHAQQALRRAKDQFEAILNATTESIFLIDREGTILAINATGARRIQHEPEQLIGQCAFPFFPPEVASTRRAALEEVFRSGQVKYVEDERAERSFGLNYYPVPGPNGSTQAVVVYAQDITQRKRAANAAQALAQRNQLLMQTATEGIHILDEAGNLLEANEAFARMLGYTPAELAHLNVAQWDAKWKPDELRTMVLELIAQGRAFETVHRRKDGSLLDVEVHTTGVRLDGRNYLYAASRDISERKRAEAQLVAREARLSALMAAMQDPVLVLDEQGRVMEYFGPPAASHPSFQAADGVVLGKLCWELMPESAGQQYAAAIAALQSQAEPQTFDYAVDASGQTLAYVVTMSRVGGPDSAAGFLTVVRDVTARRVARREIERLAQRNTLLLESVGEGIFDVDPYGKTTFANPAALALLGLTQEQMLGQNQHSLFHHHFPDGNPYPLEKCPIYEVMQDGKRRKLESEWFWRADGTGFPVSLMVTPIVEEGQRVGVVAVFQDITERKRAEAEIHRLAFHDALTLLPNRRLLNDRLEQMIAACKRSGQFGALLFLDLDNFKPLNDAHGHAVGDLLLVEVARRITHSVREIDTVARFGGDEFVVMLSKLDEDVDKAHQHAGRVAEKIRHALAQTYHLSVALNDGATTLIEHHCTASIGVALFPSQQASADEILKRGDAAMYRAKDAGRNAVHFYAPAS